MTALLQLILVEVSTGLEAGQKFWRLRCKGTNEKEKIHLASLIYRSVSGQFKE